MLDPRDTDDDARRPPGGRDRRDQSLGEGRPAHLGVAPDAGAFGMITGVAELYSAIGTC